MDVTTDGLRRREHGSFDYQTIRCRQPECDAVVATRDEWGAGLQPHGERWYREPDGRFIVRCWKCGARNRLTATARLQKGA